MGAYNEALLTLLLILSSVLIVILIIICIKLVYTTNKINIILNDIEKKSKSVNGLFHMIDRITDTASIISDGIVNGIVSIVEKVFTLKKDKSEDEEKEKEE